MCGCRTYGPRSNDDEKDCTIGEAAHIVSASSSGPARTPDHDAVERSSISNGMWLCSNCHVKVDHDVGAYSVEYLKYLKGVAEKRAKLNLNLSSAETNLDTIVSTLVIDDIEQCKTNIMSTGSAEGLTDLDYVNFADNHYKQSVANAMVLCIKFIVEDTSIHCSCSTYRKMLMHLKSITDHCNIHNCEIVLNLISKRTASTFPDVSKEAFELTRKSANQPLEEEELLNLISNIDLNH